MHQQSPHPIRSGIGQSARSPKGSGLGLCLRFSILCREPKVRGSRKDEGASLVVALVAAFVLLLGAAALATRTNFGFIGQAFQVQNRQARDVAESAITEFADTMNQEPYRHLLIAGTTANWTAAKISSDFTNICTAFDNSTDALNTNAGNPVTVAPVASIYNAFKPGAGFQSRGNGRSFQVESIEFLTQGRTPYVDSSGAFITDPASGSSYGVVYRSGGARSLIRITVIGRVEQNGRVSEARVAREFEVVPKCCNRSFGANIFGGVNWGRDSRACLNPDPAGPGLSGLFSGLGGTGQASGSGNSKPILKEDGTPVTEAACWSGNQSGTPSDLSGTPNQNCTNGSSAIGNISFRPVELSLVLPTYAPPPKTNGTAVTVTPVAVPTDRDGVIYYDSGRAGPNSNGFVNSGLVLQRSNGTISRIDGTAFTANSPDPCYLKESLDTAGGRPYSEINCLTTAIPVSGSRKVYIDTSAAKINFFFSGNGDYFGSGSGNNGVLRLHDYRSSLSSAYIGNTCVSTSPSSSCLIRWPSVTEGSPITAADRVGTFLELCSDRTYTCDPSGSKPEEFAVRNLLNFYTNGSGGFRIGGNASGLGFNIYAPNATVRFNGGGQSDNFMGQAWSNNLIINGNISMRTYSGFGAFSGGGGGSAPGTLAGIPLIDFVARSFTQSSGF